MVNIVSDLLYSIDMENRVYLNEDNSFNVDKPRVFNHDSEEGKRSPFDHVAAWCQMKLEEERNHPNNYTEYQNYLSQDLDNQGQSRNLLQTPYTGKDHLSDFTSYTSSEDFSPHPQTYNHGVVNRPFFPETSTFYDNGNPSNPPVPSTTLTNDNEKMNNGQIEVTINENDMDAKWQSSESYSSRESFPTTSSTFLSIPRLYKYYERALISSTFAIKT